MRTAALPLALVCLAPLVACDKGVAISERTVEAACAMCIYEMKDANGCFWAVMLDGKPVPATGPAIPTDHVQHGPDGMCNMKRIVVIEGTLKDGLFNATRFDLVPPEGVPDKPRYAPDDNH